MDKICNEKDCHGCRVCERICPQNAIKMIENEKGFLKPVIDEKTCTNCKVCASVCPVINKNIKKTPLKVYACKNKNEETRSSSSSGGVFHEISNYILKMNGSIYGAAFDENNKVNHMRGETLEELEKIKKSKYVQSDMGQIFKKIENDVAMNKTVLFSGTPCQVQAITNLPKIKNSNLLTVDIVCHGVPSPKIFEDYKQYLEKTYDSKIVDINFRHKNEKSTQNIKVNFEDGNTYISNFSEGDIFYKLFLKNIILRDSCYNCEYKSFERISDITLGDFWGYQKGSAKDFGDQKGISLVLINTERGLEIFNEIKNNIEFMEISKDECYPYNCFFNFDIPDKCDEFWEKYIKEGLQTSSDII